MRIFLTGATGFIGSHIVPELLAAGHQVLGLTRSDAGAKTLRAAGAEAHLGTLEDPETLRSGAAQAEGVIHCAFDHDFTNFAANCEKDRRNIAAMADVLAGSGRPLVITSGIGFGAAAPGQLATEDVFNQTNPHPRIASEQAGAAAAERGVDVSVVRLPQVHNPIKQGLITPLVQIARQKGVSAYVGDGLNRYPAVHVLDCARLYRLALEKHVAGRRYNAVAEEGVAVRDIAEALGRGLRLPVVSISPEEAPAHFGFMGMFIGADMPASSALTQQWLDWHPTGPTLLTDLAAMQYPAA